MDRSFTISLPVLPEPFTYYPPTLAAYDKELASAQNGAEVLQWLDMSGGCQEKPGRAHISSMAYRSWNETTIQKAISLFIKTQTMCSHSRLMRLKP